MSLSEIHETQCAANAAQETLQTVHAANDSSRRNEHRISRDNSQGEAHDNNGCVRAEIGGSRSWSDHDAENIIAGEIVESSKIFETAPGARVEREMVRSECSEDGDDRGGAGDRARRRMQSGGRDGGKRSGPCEREADLSVRYLMDKARNTWNAHFDLLC